MALSSAAAKAQFFLTPADLKSIPHKSAGWGALKLYDRNDLLSAAIEKHGKEGFAKKRERAQERLERKRKAEEAAEEAYASLMQAAQAPETPHTAKKARAEEGEGSGGSEGVSKVLDVSAAAPALLGNLRREARMHLSAACTWDYLRSKSSPNGCNATVRVERVDQPTFAALVGRAADPQLKSMVRKGAWFSAYIKPADFFGGEVSSIRGSGGRYNSNADLGVLLSEDFCVKYCPAQQVVSVTAYVAHLGGGW